MKTITLSAPKSIHFLRPEESWFSAPVERTPQFSVVFAKVSRALQVVLREQLPPILFRDLSRYETIEDGYSMLVFRASRPCRTRGEFTYDVLNPLTMASFFHHAERKLEEVLTEATAALSAAGREDLAALYHPRRAEKIMRLVRTQRRFRKPLHQMLVSEGRLLNELMRLAGSSNCLPDVRTRKTALFIKRWNQILRRFYSKRDFTEAGPALLRAVTRALISAQWAREFEASHFQLVA